MRSFKSRNHEIWERFCEGEPVSSLSKEYSISPARVRQLIANENTREERLKLPIGDLSLRSLNGLVNNGIVAVRLEEITPVWVATNLDEGDLRAIRHLGEKNRNEIITWLAKHGLTLRRRTFAWSPFTHQPIPGRGS